MRFTDLCRRTMVNHAGHRSRGAHLQEFERLWQLLWHHPRAAATVVGSLAGRLYTQEKRASRAQVRSPSGCAVELAVQGFDQLARSALNGKPPQRQCDAISDEEFAAVVRLFPRAERDTGRGLAKACEETATAAFELLRRDKSAQDTLRGGVLKALLNVPPRAGAGPSGLKGHAIRHMARNHHDETLALAESVIRCITEARSAEAAGVALRANLMLLDKSAGTCPGPRPIRPIAVADCFTRCVMQGAISGATDAAREQLEKGDQWGLSQAQTPVMRALEAIRMMSALTQPAAMCCFDARNAHGMGKRLPMVQGLRRLLDRVTGEGPKRETAVAQAVLISVRATAAADTGVMPIRGDNDGAAPRCAPAPERGGGQGRPDLSIVFCAALVGAMDVAKADTLAFLRRYLPAERAEFQGAGHSDALTTALWELLAPGQRDRGGWQRHAFLACPDNQTLARIHGTLSPAPGGAPAGATPPHETPDDRVWRRLHEAGFIRISAYQDDVTVSGLALITLIASHYLKSAMEDIGLELNLEKCSTVAPAQGCEGAIESKWSQGWDQGIAGMVFRPLGFRVATFDTVLGVPAGFDSPELRRAITGKILDLAKEVRKLHEAPASVTHPDVAMHLARQWVLPKAHWLASVWGNKTEPADWAPLGNAIDALLQQCIPDHCWATNPTIRKELELPESRGGLRIPIWSMFAPHAAEEAGRQANRTCHDATVSPPPAAAPRSTPVEAYYEARVSEILTATCALAEKPRKGHLARINRNCGVGAMNVFSPVCSDQHRRHTPSSWSFACWYAFARLDEAVAGEWPDPQPASMPRGTRNRLTPEDVLDSKNGNHYRARGVSIEKAFGRAVAKHAPRRPTFLVAQPRRDTIPDLGGGEENECADWEFRWSGDPAKGYVFDVTAINTRSRGRVGRYNIAPETTHSRDGPGGPASALKNAAKEKLHKYTKLYIHSEFSAYAVDLVGTPSPCSRRALVALCKSAYLGTGCDTDALYPLRMANAIQKEVAIASAKATALAIFRNPRISTDTVPPPQVHSQAADMS
jgi:hypothetical protein